MKTYIVAYGDMPSLQRAAAKGILGQQQFTGKLPITLPGLHRRGTGIQFSPYPQPTRAPTANISVRARGARVSGDVKLELEIDKNGKVVDVKTIFGEPLLVETAVPWARKWTFETSEVDVSRRALIIYRFRRNPTLEQLREDKGRIVNGRFRNHPYIVPVYY
jgi:hypothetical protein